MNEAEKIETAVPDNLSQAEQLTDLDNLAQQAANEDFIPEPDQVHQGEVETAPEISTGQMVTALLSIGFNMVAGRKGSHWNLSAEEATETGEAIGGVLDKYFPDLSESGVELTACMTVAMVLTPRLMMDKQIEAKAEAERLEARKGDGGQS